MKKTTLGWLMLVSVIVGTVFWIGSYVYADYQWKNSVLSNWNLADKSSTISAKSDYISKFVDALKSSNLADNDALIFKTADNNCANNVVAVETLRDRLNQIKGMDESSFQYQQAISQITQQEQGEAQTMLENLNGCWMKTHHYILWNPIFIGIFAVLIAIGFIWGLVFIVD